MARAREEVVQAFAMKRPASSLTQVEPDVWAIPGLDPYYLRAARAGRRLQTGEGEFVGVEYDIVRKSPAPSRSNRQPWGKPRTLEAAPNAKGRCDLNIRFYSAYNQYHTTYHRVVGLTRLPCYWSCTGKLLRRPYKVTADSWEQYHVHHIDNNPRNVALRNLAVLPKRLHDRITNESTALALPKIWPYVT